MKLSFSMVSYGSSESWIPAYSIEETIRRIRQNGYRQAELITASPHAWPYFLDTKRRKEINTCLKEYGLQISSVIPYIGGGPGANLASPDAEERAWTVQYFKDIVDLAEAFSSPLVPCMAGWILFGKNKEQAWEESREGLKQVAEYGARKNVKICLLSSDTASGILDMPEDVLKMKEEIGSSNITVGFDVRSAWNRIQDPVDYIYLFGEELSYFALCDFNGKEPGSNGADFKAWKLALDKIGYAGTVTLKLNSARNVCADSVAIKSLEYLKSWEE